MRWQQLDYQTRSKLWASCRTKGLEMEMEMGKSNFSTCNNEGFRWHLYADSVCVSTCLHPTWQSTLLVLTVMILLPWLPRVRICSWNLLQITPNHDLFIKSVNHKDKLYLEQKSWRTLVKIRCIIQKVLLFGFPEVIQSTRPHHGLLALKTLNHVSKLEKKKTF